MVQFLFGLIAGHSADARSREVSHKKKDLQQNDGLYGEALEKAYAEYRAKHITAEEEQILRTAISNQGYHYFGSGKIIRQSPPR